MRDSGNALQLSLNATSTDLEKKNFPSDSNTPTFSLSFEWCKNLISGIGVKEIVNELQEAYVANKDVLDNFKEQYTQDGNLLFVEFVEEMMFIKRNTSSLTPTTQEQYRRLLDRFLR